MRAWLWILTGAASLAGAAYAYDRKRRRMLAASRFLNAIFAALRAGKLEALMNDTPMRPDGWSDEYAGLLDKRPIIFILTVSALGGQELPGARRKYYVKWGETYLEALVMPTGPGEDRNVFERLHAELREAYRRLSSMPPPS